MSESNDAFLNALNDLAVGKEACDAINEFTRWQMYRLYHIPARYFLNPDLQEHLQPLADELGKHGYIDLDRDGQPCCLSGNTPVLRKQ